jgi:Sec-independent protein translocase protein TatA
MTEVEKKIDELALMMAQGFSELRGEMSEMGTELRAEFRTEMAQLRIEMREDMEHVFDKYVRVVRKDYDSLAGRTKKLEEAVFPQ